MKLTYFLTTWTASVPGALAYPGMGSKLLETINKASRSRSSSSLDNANVEMIGDLAVLRDDQLSAVGRSIKNILQGQEAPEDRTSRYTPPAIDSQACADDPCCIYAYIQRDMYAKFIDSDAARSSGRCTKHARAAVRLGFHDAASWSKGDTHGGADGSILLGNELTRSEHDGLQDIGILVQGWYDHYHGRYDGVDVSMADLVQMAATVATVVCPLGPRVRSFVGRKDSYRPAEKDRMPSVHASADELVDLFRNKTFTAAALVALVGAHTTSQQHFVDESRDGAPQDSTPGVWDVRFYGETKNRPSPPPRVYKFPSDVALSTYSATRDAWDSFATVQGQGSWNEAFAREYIRMSLLGVNNINDLVECTKVLPMATTVFVPPDEPAVQQWMQGKDTPNKGDAAAALEDGKSLTLVQGVLGVLGDVGSVVGGIVGGVGGVIGGIIGGLLP